MIDRCECCGAPGVQMDAPDDGIWASAGTGCATCKVAENSETWVVWCRTHNKALYPSDPGAYWDFDLGKPK